ncbi:2126_t:CDS:1, partial [Funneliformis geosporum]
GNEELNEYIWNWWAYLVQKPQKKPRTILVLKSTLQQCGKNIITDFIGDNVLGQHLHYATSDLEKILGRFNSAIQARKLIVMNETGMSSGDWHRFNGHLKSLITEGKVSIERKGLELKRLNDFAGYMVTSNQDTPIKIDIGDSRVVCFDVSARCRGNKAYFKRLGNVLDHPDAPGVVMRYLLSHDLSDFEPQEIPATKMKEEIMRNQLPNPIRFIIDYISSWYKDKVAKP